MRDRASALFSRYIIDGVQMDTTPFAALYDCLDGNGTVDVPEGPFADIIDVRTDCPPRTADYDEGKYDEYVQAILHAGADSKVVSSSYPAAWTISAIDSTLLECLWLDGHFVLSDILLMAKWDWENSAEGNMAAFWDSTAAAGKHLFEAGIRLDRYFVEENRHRCCLDISVRNDLPSRRRCARNAVSGLQLFYIPFSQGRFNLGGSALSRVCGDGGGPSPDFSDSAYFADCYEVLREMVEDKVIVAGQTIGRGGLAVAVEKFRGRCGLKMDIGGIMASRNENDAIRILFSEVPGVIVQVDESDTDYFDSQLLLQEVSYYPLGVCSASVRGVSVEKTSRSTVAAILSALIENASEGED